MKISGIVKNTGEGLVISSDNSVIGSDSWFKSNFETYSMLTKGYESAVVVIKDVSVAPEMQVKIDGYLNEKGNRVDITNSSSATQPVKDNRRIFEGDDVNGCHCLVSGSSWDFQCDADVGYSANA